MRAALRSIFSVPLIAIAAIACGERGSIHGTNGDAQARDSGGLDSSTSDGDAGSDLLQAIVGIVLTAMVVAYADDGVLARMARAARWHARSVSRHRRARIHPRTCRLLG